jgi:nuclear pore complex protein Nup205
LANLELSDQAKFRKANLEILLDFGENFLDILCRDSVCGHDIRRMLALSVIDELILLDGRGTWTFYMSNQGYLRHIIESMTVEDAQLVQLLTTDSDNMRALYTYESKMAMLTRMASTVAGAEILLESGLLVRLSEMSVFSSRPDVSPTSASDMDTDLFLIPTPLARYHQILFPALRICQALIASLGSQNRSATAQVWMTSFALLTLLYIHVF